MSSIGVVAVERQSVQTLKTLEFSMSRSGGVKRCFGGYHMSSQMVLFGQPLIKISEAHWQTLRNFIL